MIIKKWILVFLIFCFQVKVNAEMRPYYVVQPRDQLLILIQKLKLKPVYGASGVLPKVLEENPGKKPSHGDLIYPGEKIYFPADQIEKIREVAHVSSNGEISWKNNEEIISSNTSKNSTETTEPLDQPIPSEEKSAGVLETVKNRSEFLIQGGLIYEQLNAYDGSNQTSGVLRSEYAPVINLLWSPQLNEKLNLDFGISYSLLKVAKSSTKNIVDPQQNFTAVVLGVNYRLTTEVFLKAQLSQRDQLIDRALTLNDIQIEKASMTEMALGLGYHFLSEQKINLMAQAAYLHSLPYKNDFYDINAIQGYRLAFSARQNLSAHFITGEVFFEERQFTAEPVKFKDQKMGLTLGFGWLLGE